MYNTLIKEAYKAFENSHSPYSNFKVGAALLTEDGKIYTGCNVENVSYGLTICAERTAAVKAVSEGHKKFKNIAIVSSGGDYTYPCGACRQFLAEFADETFEFILHNNKEDQVKVVPIGEMLPYLFEL